MMNTTEILRGAKDYIIDHGWIQGTMKSGEDQVCSLGAVYVYRGSRADIPTTQFFRAIDIISALAGGTNGDGYWTLTKWNDAPGRTEAEVLALFDAGITIAQQQEALTPELVPA